MSDKNDFDKFKTPEEAQVFVANLSNETRKLLLNELLKEKFPEIEDHNFRIEDENPDNRRSRIAKQTIDGKEVQVKYKSYRLSDDEEILELLDLGDVGLNEKYKDILSTKPQYFTWNAWMNETKKANKKVPFYITSESGRQEAEEGIEKLKSQGYDHVQIVNIGKPIRELGYGVFLMEYKMNGYGFFHVDNVFKGVGKIADFWSAAVDDNKNSFTAYFLEIDPNAGTNKSFWNIVSDYKGYGFSGRCIKK